jgi:hypothetical protein
MNRPTSFFTVALAAALMAPAAAAQSFDVGTNAINLGIGLGGYRYSYVASGASGYSVSPTLAFSYERGVAPLGPGVLGVGAFLANKSVRYEATQNYPWANTTYNYDQRWSNTIIGLRGSWHYNEWHGMDELDVYGGLMLGYNIGSYRNRSTRTINGVTSDYDYGYSGSISFATFSTYLGARYYFTEKIGAYLEFGYGIAYLNLGLAARF